MSNELVNLAEKLRDALAEISDLRHQLGVAQDDNDELASRLRDLEAERAVELYDAVEAQLYRMKVLGLDGELTAVEALEWLLEGK